jgi:hypothetical protein
MGSMKLKELGWMVYAVFGPKYTTGRHPLPYQWNADKRYLATGNPAVSWPELWFKVKKPGLWK